MRNNTFFLLYMLYSSMKRDVNNESERNTSRIVTNCKKNNMKNIEFHLLVSKKELSLQRKNK